MEFIKWQETDKKQAGGRVWKIKNKCPALWGGREIKILLWLHLSFALFTWHQPDGDKTAAPETNWPTLAARLCLVLWLCDRWRENDQLSPGKRCRDTPLRAWLRAVCAIVGLRAHFSHTKRDINPSKSSWAPLETYDMKGVSLEQIHVPLVIQRKIDGFKPHESALRIKSSRVKIDGFTLNI